MKSFDLLKLSTAALLSALIVSGCRCDEGGPTAVDAELAATPRTVSFEACPTKDENGATVAEVFPDEQKFTLDNIGKAAATIQSITVTDDDNGAFKIADDKKPTSVAPLEAIEIPIRFSPSKKGDIRGKVTIVDGSPETDDLVVDLIGTGKNAPAQPTVQLEFETVPGGAYQICDPTVLANCAPTFPDTFYGQQNTLKFRLKNLGCPSLKITNISIEPEPNQAVAELAYAFSSGFIAPTTQNPATLNSADDNSEIVFNVNFAPVEDPSAPNDGQRYAILKIATNDPLYPTFNVSLAGVGAKPSAYVTPSFCNFTNQSDFCGNTQKIANKARIAVGNAGTRNIKVKSVSFVNGGRGGRFTVTGTSIVGQDIAPGQFAYQEVTFQDQPLFVSDDLIIATTDFQDLTQSAGDVRVTFYGGTLPCLSTEPADQLSYENPTAELTVKDVVIKNGATCGTLTVDDVVVDQPNAFFSVTDKGANTVAPGAQTIAKVQFKKPVSGGQQTGVLRIKTNDPAYGPDPYKVITLYSQAPVNQLPVAVVKAPNGNESSFTIKKDTVIAQTQGKIRISGADSYDPPGGAGSVAKYQWFLALKPSGATGASLSPLGETTTNYTDLTIDSTVTGEYRVALKVKDAEGQSSSNLATMKIFITP